MQKKNEFCLRTPRNLEVRRESKWNFILLFTDLTLVTIMRDWLQITNKLEVLCHVWALYAKQCGKHPDTLVNTKILVAFEDNKMVYNKGEKFTYFRALSRLDPETEVGGTGTKCCNILLLLFLLVSRNPYRVLAYIPLFIMNLGLRLVYYLVLWVLLLAVLSREIMGDGQLGTFEVIETGTMFGYDLTTVGMFFLLVLLLAVRFYLWVRGQTVASVLC